ncbi:hypothetical protein BH11PLA2_BH11PLA2_34480 [soil metagenome]
MKRGMIVRLGFAVTALFVLVWQAGIRPVAESVKDSRPVNQRFGWDAKSAATHYPVIRASLPKFAIGGGEDDPARRVVLTDAVRVVNDGKFLPTFFQPIGCCVGAGAGQGMQILLALQAFKFADGTRPVELWVPYHFACGRNAPECGNGQFGRNPNGSCGSWQALAIQKYGVLPKSAVPDLKWDAATASSWAIRMPDQKFVALGRLHPVRTIARAESSEDVRHAIQNWYIVTIASDWGGLDRPPVVDIGDGVRVLLNRHAGTWSHQMVVVGYQMAGGKKYFNILNSWGADHFGQPPDSTQPGSFWVSEADMQYIVRQGDSWIYSDAVGFPAQDLDLNLFGRLKRPKGERNYALAQ